MQSIYVILFPTIFGSSLDPAQFLYGNQLFYQTDLSFSIHRLSSVPLGDHPQPSLGFQSPSYLPYAFVPNRDAFPASAHFFYSAL